MLVFLLALLLCEVLAEPPGERPVHPVPEELFLRSFLTFPGGPQLASAAVSVCGHGVCAGSTLPYTLPCEGGLCMLASVLHEPVTPATCTPRVALQASASSQCQRSNLELCPYAGAAIASRQARLVSGRYQLPQRATCSSLAGPGFCINDAAAELHPGARLGSHAPARHRLRPVFLHFACQCSPLSSLA